MARVWAAVLGVLLVAGTAAADPPKILDVKVDRGRDTDVWGAVTYHQTVTARVKAGAPGDALGALKVTDPANRFVYVGTTTSGGSVTVDPTAPSRYSFWQHEEPDGSITCWYSERMMPAPPAAGPYKIEISANNTDLTTLFTAPTPAVPTEGPAPAAPDRDAVIDTTAPTFQWSNTFAGASTVLAVREEGNASFTTPMADDAGVVWQFGAGTGTEATYDSDGSATRVALQPGAAYCWELRSTRIDDNYITSPVVQLSTTQTARRRFTVSATWPSLPDLPGKLAYADQLWGDWSWDFDSGSLLQYGRDPASRKWLAPEGAEYPNWSADGKELLYYRNDLGLWIDYLDGTPPYHIPVEAWMDPSWSPDGSAVAYGWVPAGASHAQIWVANIDGSNLHLLAKSDTGAVRRPAWSPDGAWIAYPVRDDTNQTSALWMAHPDATEAHAVAATGVVGWAGYAVSWVDLPSWSPDMAKLVMSFSADDPVSKNSIAGIGTIPVKGGPVTPIFLAPPGIVCCASPNSPIYSPSGTKIAFTSAHHLTPDPEWANGKFEPGVEVWLLNANGSGEPQRLTYDFSYNSELSWWAPPLFPDVRPGNWAYNAVNTCQESGIVGGYPDGKYHPSDQVTRDQMAVYVSRALAGGDAQVPTGPAAASFPDVPTTCWAFKYVEYAKAKGIVSGYPDGTYQPGNPVDRAGMAVYIARAMAGSDSHVPPASSASFPDVPTDFWAFRYIEYVKAQGVVQGYPEGTYQPGEVVTRDQMAIYVARAFKLPM